MPLFVQKVSLDDVSDRISDIYQELLDAKDVVLSNLQYQKESLSELKGRTGIDPQELDAYRKDIISNQHAARMVDSKLNRVDTIRTQKSIPCLTIKVGTTKAELAVCLEGLTQALKSSRHKEEKLFLTSVYETIESWKERLSMDNVTIEQDIIVPLREHEQHRCDVLISIAEYQYRFQATEDPAEKYAIFIEALESNKDHHLDAFIKRACKDKKWISPTECLEKIKAIYPLLIVDPKKKKRFSTEEIDILDGLRASIKNLVQSGKSPIDGEALNADLNAKVLDATSTFSRPHAKSYSYYFKQLINEVYKYLSFKAPFSVTEIKNQIVKSVHDKFKHELKSLTPEAPEVESPMNIDRQKLL